MPSIYVIAEDALAGTISKHLVDRFVPERTHETWLREQWQDNRETARTYKTVEAKTARAHIPSVLRGKAKDVFKAWKLVSAAIERAEEQDAAMLLAFDSDHRDEALRLRSGVESVRQLANAHGLFDDLAIVTAEATPEFDAWVLLGHEPRNDREKKLLSDVTKELGFDPRKNAQRLNSTTENERDAKKLCMRILDLSEQASPTDPRVMNSLDTDLAVLLANDQESGLSEFINDIETCLLPWLGDSSRDPNRIQPK